MGGGAAVAIALGGGFWKWSQFPAVEKPNASGVEKWVPTVCAQCMGGCGILGMGAMGERCFRNWDARDAMVWMGRRANG